MLVKFGVENLRDLELEVTVQFDRGGKGSDTVEDLVGWRWFELGDVKNGVDCFQVVW